MAQNPTSTWSETGTGTNDGATAIHAASTIGAANRTYFVTNISGHTDMDSIVQVLDGTTVKWETAVAVAAGRDFGFPVHIPITPATACSGKVVTSASDCAVNIQGYSIP